MVGFGGMMRSIQNKVVDATKKAVEVGKTKRGNSRRRRNLDAGKTHPALTCLIHDDDDWRGRTQTTGNSEGQSIPVKKAQLGDLFHPLPTEVSVRDGFWQDYYPTQATFTPCQFYIPQSSDFIDMGMCELVLGVKIVKADGADMDHTLNIGVVNNVGHSLIKRFDVKLNDTSVGEPTDLYHYKAYDSNLRNFSQDQKDNYLQIEGWHTDESTDAKMNNFTTGTVNTPILATAAAYNKGFDERTRLFYSNYTKDGTGNGGADTAQASREIDFNDPQFVLMAGADSTARFKITRAVFRVRHVKVQAEAHLEVEDKQYKQQKTVVYPIRTSKPIRRTIEAGKSFVSFTDLFQQSVPDYLTIGFVRSTAFNGAYNENPYNFKLFGLKDFRMVVNGVERPKSRFEFKSHDAMEGKRKGLTPV
ncbi:hypothetical protein QZH41_005893 [Actinostola sp. cb2023]|nr:hypothetical protein QZH41_005893 [Actinostola sp. cb2023]